LNRIDHGWHAIFITTEVDDAIGLLVTTTSVTSGDETLVITATLLLARDHQGLEGLGALRQLLEVARGHAASARRGWFVFSNSHLISTFY
jgi:hypothetical protein